MTSEHTPIQAQKWALESSLESARGLDDSCQAGKRKEETSGEPKPLASTFLSKQYLHAVIPSYATRFMVTTRVWLRVGGRDAADITPQMKSLDLFMPPANKPIHKSFHAMFTANTILWKAPLEVCIDPTASFQPSPSLNGGAP
jgi:hypothetical protein